MIFDEGHITVAVHPRARGRRIGELLLANIMALASANGAVVNTLEVRPSNDAALSPYRRMGFEEKGHRRVIILTMVKML